MFSPLLRNLIAVVSGKEPEFAMEHRLFNVASFFITAFAIIASIINYAIGLQGQTVWISLVGGAASFCMFYFARYRHYFSINLIFCYVFLAVFILGSMY